ncbi:MAG: HTH-type transcriptional regulator, sugar sensing transcriptional regulator [Thermoplasmata archaeon]|jgi:sugar-specific transcriptional regulator TrmB|nr:HTH-type transcriptional regulator, sugar sensing transcriptional regulator [Thermoplasmata archaeon]
MSSPIRLQDAISTVSHALDLKEAEAAIYVRLCLAGPAKAGDLATALKMHRNEVYRNVTRLLGRGLVEMTLERPARYAAVSPQHVFDTEISTRLASVDELKLARDSVFPLLTQLRATADAPMKSTYKVVQGRAEIHALRDRLVEGAQESLDWASTFLPSLSMADRSGTLSLMQQRARDHGVKLRALVRVGDANLPHLDRFKGLANASFREPALETTIRFLIVDGRELLMWVVNDPSESAHARDEVAIHTTAPGFVQAESLFFEQTWARGRPILGDEA